MTVVGPGKLSWSLAFTHTTTCSFSLYLTLFPSLTHTHSYAQKHTHTHRDIGPVEVADKETVMRDWF